tara:strand:- start:8365 stop:8820 length:456 start_codon:yes stop_codon:yes gene_type:complete
MTVQTNASTSIAVSVAAPATHDAAGFNALTFTAIGEIVSTGEKGGAAALVTHSPLDTRTVAKFKGSVNYGSYAISLALDLADAGQILLDSLAIGASIDVVASFEETKQDGSKEFYRAIVMTYTRVGGTIDAIIGSNATLEITDSIVDVAAP